MTAFSNEEWRQQFDAALRRRFLGRSTAKHYMSDLSLFCHFYQGPLPEVTSQDIQRFVDDQHGKGLSPATVKRRVAALKTFYDFVADTLGDADRPNPVSMRRHAGRQPLRLPRDVADDAVARFLAAVHSVRDRAIVAVMLYAGLRVGEVAALRPEEIGVPVDPQAAVRLRVIGKGAKERCVYLCRDGYALLQAYLEASPTADAHGPLFRNERGGALSVAGIQDRIARYAAESGVPATCHQFRHTYGRWMVESGMPVLALARLLGHSSVHTTQRYIDGADPEVRQSYEAAMAAHPGRGEEPAPSAPPPTPAPIPAKPTVVRPEASRCDTTGWLPDAPAAIRAGCLEWLDHQWLRWKPWQREHHARTRLRELRLFWGWQLAHRKVSRWEELTTADLAAFTEAQLARGLAATTIKAYVDRVYEVMRYRQSSGKLASLPVRPALVLPDPLPQHLQPAEVVALAERVAVIEREGKPKEQVSVALYYLLGHGGLRISEALDLQVGELDFAGQRVRVRDGKGRRDRVVFLTAKATAVLGSYLATVPHAPGDLVLSWQGKPLSYEQAWARIVRLGKEAGVSPLSPQRLRHTYATQLLNHGMSIEGLRRLMGHEDLNTTLVYARLADTTLEAQYRSAVEHLAHSSTNLANSV